MAAAAVIRANFDDLRDLHKCANELLLSPTIQQALKSNEHDHDHDHYSSSSSTILIREVQETILRMLDSCGTIRDILLLITEQIQNLRSASRRMSIGLIDNSSFESKLASYTHQRKQLKKKLTTCLRSLKQMKKYNKYFFTSDLSLIDHNLIVVVHVLRELRLTTIAIVESLVSIVSVAPVKQQQEVHRSCFIGSSSLFGSKIIPAPPKLTCGEYDLTSKWVNYQDHDGSSTLLEPATEAYGSNMEDLEAELECIMRRLIQTRASLLNVVNN